MSSTFGLSAFSSALAFDFAHCFSLVVAMMLAQSIDVTGDDQGLKQVLEVSQVQDVVRTYLTEACGIKTTTDLLGYFAAATFEAEIKEVLTDKFPVTETFKAETQRLYVSRLRAAYKLGVDTDKRIRAEAEKPPPPKDEDNLDLERPLDQASIDRLEANWTEMHHLKLINFMRPAPQFRNRLFRELHNKVARLVLVEKVKSMEDNRLASEPEKRDVGPPSSDGSKLVLESVRKTTRNIQDCLGYLTALRILMHSYAYCGSHKVASSADVDKQVVFFPLELAIGYVDEVTNATLAMHTLTEWERLGWLRRRDEQVRGEMVALINDSFTGGDALQKAWHKLAHIWIIRDGAASSVDQEDDRRRQDDDRRRGQVRPRSENKGTGAGKDRSKKGRTTEDVFRGVKRSSADSSGVKFCGAYNGKKGCVWHEKNCPQRAKHICNVFLPSGEICRSTQHGAFNHR